MVYTWGDYTTSVDYASAVKPWYTHFLLEAIEDGKISSVNDKVNIFEPRLNTLNANLGYKDRNITWKDFANQTSCYGVSENPGTAFNYNDYQIALYADTLFTKVYGVSWERVNSDILNPKLSNILQFEDGTMFNYPGTASTKMGRIMVSPRDFARFGILYLHDGNWNGIQVIPASFAKMVTTNPLSASLPGSAKISAKMIPGQRTIGSDVAVGHGDGHEPELGYSYTWWVNGLDKNGNRHWPGVPPDAYGAFGHDGEDVMLVIPSLDMVVSWTGAKIPVSASEATAIKMLVDSVVSGPTATPTPTPISQFVQNFTLMNADTDQPIYGYDPITNNSTINLASLPTRNLNIRANTNPSVVGSVKFGYDGNSNYSTENGAPHALAGDNAGNYKEWTPSLGNHTLSATLYSLSSGTTGHTLTISSTIKDGSPISTLGRIAISSDGNEHDCDDINSTSMAIALLSKSGNASKLVYYGYADHIWSTGTDGACNGGNREEEMRISSYETAALWGGFDLGVFINAKAQTAKAITALKDQINLSSAANPLWIIGAGPMEVIGRALVASDPGKRQYVTVVSHSYSNDYHAEEPGHGSWNFSELGSVLGAKLVHIIDQNAGTKVNESDYAWLQQSANSKLNWLWQRHLVSGLSPTFDPSDAGMTYWLITGASNGGDQNARPAKLRNILEGIAPTPTPTPIPTRRTNLNIVSGSISPTMAIPGGVASQ
jgi:hypothetical protein